MCSESFGKCNDGQAEVVIMTVLTEELLESIF